MWNPILCMCVLSYNLRILSTNNFPFLAELFNMMEFLAPIVFIVCIRVNFQEPFAIGLIEKLAFLALLPSVILSKMINVTNDASEGPFPWLLWIPYLISLLCVLAAFLVAIKDWSTDLVDKRRQLRTILVFGFSPLIIIALTLHALAIIYPTHSPEYNSAIASIYGFSAFILILIGGYLEPVWYGKYERNIAPPIHSSPPIVKGDNENKIGLGKAITEEASSTIPNHYTVELQALNDAMEKQKYYRQAGITIAQLANVTNQPEYRLRKAINQGLGFRNFKSYLNQYRTLDAANQLRQKNQIKSILDISIDAGFNGLSTFNRAFKDHFGETPTEFRNKTE